MPVIELPQLRASNVLAVQLEQAEVAGSAMWIVTVPSEHNTCPPRRRWFSDELAALAYAAEQADKAGLLLIDLRDIGEPQ